MGVSSSSVLACTSSRHFSWTVVVVENSTEFPCLVSPHKANSKVPPRTPPQCISHAESHSVLVIKNRTNATTSDDDALSPTELKCWGPYHQCKCDLSSPSQTTTPVHLGPRKKQTDHKCWLIGHCYLVVCSACHTLVVNWRSGLRLYL